MNMALSLSTLVGTVSSHYVGELGEELSSRYIFESKSVGFGYGNGIKSSRASEILPTVSGENNWANNGHYLQYQAPQRFCLAE
jgi:hypothetical protein